MFMPTDEWARLNVEAHMGSALCFWAALHTDDPSSSAARIASLDSANLVSPRRSIAQLVHTRYRHRAVAS